MNKVLITKEFDKLYTIVKDTVEKKKYKPEANFLATYLNQAMTSIENLFITLNNEIEELKKKI